MEAMNCLITGVGGQGTILASDILSAVGLGAGHQVKKSDILGLAVRGGAVVGHVRWGERVYSPIVPQGCADFLVAFEVLEGLRRLDQVRPAGTVLINEQMIHPVSTVTGGCAYPNRDEARQAFGEAVERVLYVPGLRIARDVGSAKMVNVVLLGALSHLLEVEPEIWETALVERVPSRYRSENLQAFRRGREWANSQEDES
jgi:indolepyruvate ferredoxin oxidoreductase beta subunit